MKENEGDESMGLEGGFGFVMRAECRIRGGDGVAGIWDWGRRCGPVRGDERRKGKGWR